MESNKVHSSWSQLPIPSTPNERSGIISSKTPDLPDNPRGLKYQIIRWSNLDGWNYLKTYQGVDNIEHEITWQQLIRFYQENNSMNNGNLLHLTQALIKAVKQVEGVIIVMLSGGHQIIGSILSLPVKIEIRTSQLSNLLEENIYNFGCSTFLCIARPLRHLNLAMILIKELINYGYHLHTNSSLESSQSYERVICDYHLTGQPVTPQKILIPNWFRPIQPARARQLGFVWPDSRNLAGQKLINNTKKRRQKREQWDPDSRFLNQPLDTDYQFALINLDDSRNPLIYRKLIGEWQKNYRVKFHPSYPEWLKWVSGFSTYLLTQNEQIIGITMVYLSDLEVSGSTIIDLAHLITIVFMAGERIDLLMKGLIWEYRERAELLYVMETGPVTRFILEEIMAFPTTTQLYFERYNHGTPYTIRDLSIPLL